MFLLGIMVYGLATFISCFWGKEAKMKQVKREKMAWKNVESEEFEGCSFLFEGPIRRVVRYIGYSNGM